MSGFNFCPHCGKTIGQDQPEGKILMCKHCGKPVGTPAVQVGTVVGEKKMIDQGEQLIKQGVAARCPLCQQIIEIRGTGAKTFVPHYQKEKKKICQASGKPIDR